MKRDKTSRFGIVALAWILGTLGAANGCTRGPAPTPVVVGAQTPVWHVGSAYEYELELKSEAKLPSADARLDFTLTSSLRVTPLRSTSDVTEIALALEGARFGSSRTDNDHAFEALADELRAPVLVTLVSGKLSGARQPPKISAFAASIQRSIMAALQFVPPPSGKGSVWQAEELDGTGRFTAEYREQSDGQVQKKKLRYAPVAASRVVVQNALTGRVADLTPQVESSEGTWWLEPSGRLSRLELREVLAVNVLGSSPVHSQTSLRLSLHEQSPAPPVDWESRRAATISVAVDRPPSGETTTDLGLARAKVGDLTFGRALAELEAAEKDEKQRRIRGEAPEGEPNDQERAGLEGFGRRQARVFTGLTTLMRIEPKTVDEALSAIHRGSVADKALLDALAASQAASGEAALVKLVQDRKLSGNLRTKAASSLIRVRHPTQAGIDALIALLDDEQLGMHATYGLGTFARRLREGGAVAESDKISKRLVDRLGRVRGASNQATVLRGIGNSAYLGALPSVRPFLTDDHASLRLAGVQALRLMDHPDVPALLAERLEGDTASKVRIAALEAASKRSATQVLERAIEHVATTAPDAQSRLNAVALLELWSRERPQLRQSLAFVAKNDKELEIQLAAARALGM